MFSESEISVWCPWMQMKAVTLSKKKIFPNTDFFPALMCCNKFLNSLLLVQFCTYCRTDWDPQIQMILFKRWAIQQITLFCTQPNKTLPGALTSWFLGSQLCLHAYGPFPEMHRSSGAMLLSLHMFEEQKRAFQLCCWDYMHLLSFSECWWSCCFGLSFLLTDG